jgi:hypothetical protein
MTKLPNSEQSYKGKVKTHKYINRQNQSTYIQIIKTDAYLQNHSTSMKLKSKVVQRIED